MQQPSEKHTLYDDTYNLLTGLFRGHMARHAYVGSKKGRNPNNEGPKLWEQFIASVGDDYAYWRERHNVERHAAEIRGLLPNYISLIELGPGSQEAVEQKTVKLIEAFNSAAAGKQDSVRQYVSYDINYDFATKAAQKVYDRFKINSRPEQGDLTDEDRAAKIKVNNSPVMVVFGGTLFNAPVIKGIKSSKIIEGYLENLAKMIGPGGHLIITQDTSDSEESRNAYLHAACEKTCMSILNKMKTDLPITGLNTDDFHYEVEWDNENHLLSMNAVYHNQTPTEIEMGGRKWPFNWGQKLPLVNAFKFPASMFRDMAHNAGYEVVKSYDDNDGIAVHVLKVKDTQPGSRPAAQSRNQAPTVQ